MAADYYKVLGISRTATPEEIKKAFRTLAHEHHPDKKGGNATKFKEINEAYQVLSNPEKRSQYDQFGSTHEQAGRQGGFNWQNMGGQPFGQGGASANFDFGDLGDILGDMFGFGAQQRAHASGSRGSDIETTVTIRFEESYTGVQKDISLYVLTKCKHCSGTGNDPTAKVTTCTKCNGKGSINAIRNTMFGAMRTETICPECNGEGKKSSKKCTVCGGSTVTKEQQHSKVTIPAGIADGQSLRLSGKGEAGRNGGPAGDLYLRVHVSTDKRFERHEDTVNSREEVPLSVLISGGSITAATVTGSVKLKIPAGTKSGTSFVLASKGFERLSHRGRGDQLVIVHAQVPTKLTNKQKKLLEEFEQETLKSGTGKNWW